MSLGEDFAVEGMTQLLIQVILGLSLLTFIVIQPRAFFNFLRIMNQKSLKIKKDLIDELLKEGIEVEELWIKIDNEKEAEEHKNKLKLNGIEWAIVEGKVQIKKKTESSSETTETTEKAMISTSKIQGYTTTPHSSTSSASQILQDFSEPTARKVKDPEILLPPYFRPDFGSFDSQESIYFDTRESIDFDNPQTVIKFIQDGAKVNVKNSKGQTPLHVAARKGFTEVVEELLKHNAQVNAVDKYGNTALLYALLTVRLYDIQQHNSCL